MWTPSMQALKWENTRRNKSLKCLLSNFGIFEILTYAVKSAAPVAANVASLFKVAAQTAPLCPKNVPIQSPVSPWRNIGFPSIVQPNR